jgi:hypothetical protein
MRNTAASGTLQLGHVFLDLAHSFPK